MSLRDVLLALIPPVCWGIGFAVAKPAVAQFPPLFMMFAIYSCIALALVIMSALFWAAGQVLARKLGRDGGIVQLKGLAIAALPQLALATIVLESHHIEAIRSAGWREWSPFVFVGVIGFYVPYVLWYSL